MPQTKYNKAGSKRLVLIADDEFINRELLKAVLEDQYDLIFAENGPGALSLAWEYREMLSLVLLDLIMPGMHGLDVLRRMKGDSELAGIPVIVLTADSRSEVESLGLGAMDFITKPYPDADIIRARVRKTIELSEDRDIIGHTERDSLTGLYNKEYFYSYAEQFDRFHTGTEMDAIIFDINHFHMINERYGRAAGDDILIRIAAVLKAQIQGGGGMVCRINGDCFLVYCPHRNDYSGMLEAASVSITPFESSSAGHVRLRMGVYSCVDKTLDIETRFDRARIAADTIRGHIGSSVAEYDSALHERQLYAEQLIDSFQDAIDQRQFIVYYQPKFDIRPDVPVLSAAEALVRWKHPKLGMISPGTFIPLFEENGLIQKLDTYVWRETAAQISEWKKRLGKAVPVSVNVSRIDMYDPDIETNFNALMERYDLTPREFLLEITESAYTENSDQIVNTVLKLRKQGFKIEMDDFGTGYSSLGMISNLPIDALKLDMMFIRNAFGKKKDMRMLELIIDIAAYLGVPVIAEGVEEAGQVKVLREMGCDLVQGYYFSKPLPPEEFERFLIERPDDPDLTPGELWNTRAAGSMRAQAQEHAHHGELKRSRLRQGPGGASGRVFADRRTNHAAEEQAAAPLTDEGIAQALASGYMAVYYVDIQTGRFLEYSSDEAFRRLYLPSSGDDIFKEWEPAAERAVYPEDLGILREGFTKEKVQASMALGGFSLSFRLMIGGSPERVVLRAAGMNGAGSRYAVIGVYGLPHL